MSSLQKTVKAYDFIVEAGKTGENSDLLFVLAVLLKHSAFNSSNKFTSEPITLKDVVAATGLQKQTIARIIEHLIGNGMVEREQRSLEDGEESVNCYQVVAGSRLHGKLMQDN